jgi:serine protease SohB
MDTLIQLSLFVAQTIIIVVAILIIAAGITAIIFKGKIKERTKIKLRKLNKYYKELADIINKDILTKTEYKKQKKAQKRQRKQAKKAKQPPRIFVVNFSGDIKASAVNSLREEITAILTVATPQDKVLAKIESCGGMVHGYGLGASQLQRIKDAKIKLIVSVDKVAASGGYMMASVADKIIAAPFAILGSIGVIAQLPNFHRFLKKHDVDFEQITAGEYKRTLTLFGENTSRGRNKLKEEVEDIHILFKDFIKQNRSKIDIDKVATGEHWFAKRAIDLHLVDELITSDDYLLKASKEAALFEVTYSKKKKFYEKFVHGMQSITNKITSWLEPV